MADRIYSATDRQVVLALALAIQNHPLIKEIPIFNVGTPAGEQPQRVVVNKFRTYSGLELPEQGLTVSVFPTGGYTTKASLELEHYTLGRPEPGDYSDRVKFRMTIRASITDADFDVPLSVSYFLSSDEAYGPFGRKFEHVEPATQDEPVDATAASIIYVTPAEEMLRDFMTLIRYVIRDMDYFLPYGLRNPSILFTNYPSTATISQTQAENLLFHVAETVVEFDIYETNLARQDEGLYLVETVRALLTKDEIQNTDFENYDRYFSTPEDDFHIPREEWDNPEQWTDTPELTELYNPTQYPGYQKPSLSITAQTQSLDEDSGATVFEFTVTRVGDDDLVVTVNWEVTGAGQFPAVDQDFVGDAFPSGALSFAAEETSKTITFSVSGDIVRDRDSTFAVVLLNSSTNALISKGRAIATIVSDD